MPCPRISSPETFQGEIDGASIGYSEEIAMIWSVESEAQKQVRWMSNVYVMDLAMDIGKTLTSSFVGEMNDRPQGWGE